MNRKLSVLFYLFLIILTLSILLASCESFGDETTVDESAESTLNAPESTAGGNSGDDTTEIETEEITTEAPHVHAWSEWNVTLAATCTADGAQERTCACGEKESQTLNALGHSEVTDAAVAATCTEEGVTEGKHCSVCNEVTVPQQKVEKIAHSVNVINAGFAPTCTKWGLADLSDCSVCKTSISTGEFLSPIGHNYTDGKCSNCQKVQIDFTDLGIYASNEGYTYFATAQNGDGMRALYDEMKKVLSEFHTSSTTDAPYREYSSEAGAMYTVALFNFRKHGLTLTEAQTVYSVFRKDHPLFYWMSYMLYWNYDSIIISTVEDYAKGADRAKYNDILMKGIEEYVSLTDGETSAYNIALAYYDAILKNNTYAYDSTGGVDPSQWAHSIIGDFVYDKFVCEGYAKLFQLLLNVSGVENIYVSGDAFGSHFWNLVKLDDGQWYWFDLTWGDTDSSPYRYFCQIDQGLTTHKPTPSNQQGLYFNIPLPERSKSAFTSDTILEYGETFTVSGCEYKLCAPGTVKLVSGSAGSEPRVAYNGCVYEIAN